MQFTPNDHFVRFILETLFGPGEGILQGAEAGDRVWVLLVPALHGGEVWKQIQCPSKYLAKFGCGGVWGWLCVWKYTNLNQEHGSGRYFLYYSFSWALTVCGAQCTCPEGTRMDVCSPEFQPWPPCATMII